MELETPRLRLDALRLDDAPALYGYRSDPEVSRYQNWRPASQAEVERFIRRQAAICSPAPEQWMQRAIRLCADGTLVGDLAFCVSADGQAEFGVTLAPSGQGQGYAREALRGLFGFLFNHLDVHRVHASIDPRNTPSMAMVRALGLRQEAHFRESLRFHGEWVDDVVFAMLAREWREMDATDTGDAATR